MESCENYTRFQTRRPNAGNELQVNLTTIHFVESPATLRSQSFLPTSRATHLANAVWFYSRKIHNYTATSSGNKVDVIYLDFSKAFDKVPHHLLLRKHETLGIRGSLLAWFQSYFKDRKHRVVLQGVCSEWLPVSSGFLKVPYSAPCYVLFTVTTSQPTLKKIHTCVICGRFKALSTSFVSNILYFNMIFPI